MARVCQVSKSRRNKANTVSFSNKKNRKFQEPNLQTKRFWDEAQKRWVKLRVTPRVIRTITKRGLRSTLKGYGTSQNILN